MANLKGQLFARLALDYFDHPKIAALSSDAIVAHLEMIVYARRYGTDGRIPNRIANRFGSVSLNELASNDPERPSIVIHDDGSVTVHDYSDYQETRDQIEARRQVNAENGRRGGRPANRTANRTGTQSVSDSGSETKAETETETDNPPSVGVRAPARRARPLPDDWQPNTKHHQIATDRGVNLNDQAEQMRDWAKSKGETKKDWDAAFNNWLRRAKPDPTIRPTIDRHAQILLLDRQRRQPPTTPTQPTWEIDQ